MGVAGFITSSKTDKNCDSQTCLKLVIALDFRLSFTFLSPLAAEVISEDAKMLVLG